MKNLLIGLFLSLGVAFASIDINHADVSELSSLKGIGKSKAENIIAYKEKNGCFKNITQLQEVKGIGKKTIDQNKDNIKIVPCEKKSL